MSSPGNVVQLFSRQATHLSRRIGHAEQIRSSGAIVIDQLSRMMRVNPDLALDQKRVKDFNRACSKALCPERNLNDLFGFRLLYEDPDSIVRLRALNNKFNPVRLLLESKGIKILSFEDFHETPKSHGHMATHIDFLVKKTGGKGQHWEERMEAQIMHADIKRAYKSTEPYYHVFREAREYAANKGRKEERLWLPQEREVLLPLQSFINATYEAWGYHSGVMGLRNTAPVYRSELEAFEATDRLSLKANMILGIYEAYERDIESVFDHFRLRTHDFSRESHIGLA